MIITYREQTANSLGDWREYVKRRMREVKEGRVKRCPRGCDRGICRAKELENMQENMQENDNCIGISQGVSEVIGRGRTKCRYDFECKYCKDRLSGVSYKMDLKTEFPGIKYHYNRIDNKYIDDLNEKIVRENRYIGKINKDIRKTNQHL